MYVRFLKDMNGDPRSKILCFYCFSLLLLRAMQAHKVKIEFHKGGEDHTYMRVDGEPWQQELPLDTDPTVMEITHKGQAVILASGDCVAKIIPADESAKMNLPISQATVADEQKQQGSASRKSRHSKKV